MTVKVQDNGSPPLSTNCFLNVAIDDVNNNSPSFDYIDEFYQTNMRRSLSANRDVYRVYATDKDVGLNGQVSYSLGATTPSCPGCFKVDQDGWITRGSGSLQPTSQVCSIELVCQW